MASYTDIKELLTEQGQKIVQLSADMSNMMNEVSDIKRYLYSDANTHTKGIVEKTMDNEKRLDKIELREKIYLAKWGVVTWIAATVGGGIVWFIDKFIVKN